MFCLQKCVCTISVWYPMRSEEGVDPLEDPLVVELQAAYLALYFHVTTRHCTGWFYVS